MRLLGTIQQKTCLTLTLCCFSSQVTAEESEDEFLGSLSLEGLLNLTVSSASGVEESIRDAPAAMIVITAYDIQQRGYTDLTEILSDLPGFDTMITQGTQQTTSYQRGYRTPFMQRTLLLVNGNVDNKLWSHTALFSRQYPISNLERIEVLYGPAGAIYGPNAFLGVINIITKAPTTDDENKVTVNIEAGSYSTRAIDFGAHGSAGEVAYSFGYKTFKSDEAGLSDMAPWGFMTAAQLSNRTIYGAVLDHNFKDIQYGTYANRSDEWGFTGEIGFGDFTFGYINWETKNGYGPYYASDRAQPNQTWNNSSRQLYLEHNVDMTDKLKVKTVALTRESRIWGGWVEAEPDWNSDLAIISPSYLSISDWNSLSSARLFKQDYNYALSDTLRVSGGIKYETKVLNKAYEICYYWTSAVCAAEDPEDLGPTDNGPGIFHSTDGTAIIGPTANSTALPTNIAETTDEGVYVQGIWDMDAWRFNVGLRYDKNSIYGSTVNPRASAVWKLSDKMTLKALYGTAFQEPAPTQLFGGWSGRSANPLLQPEEMTNMELILMYQGDHMLHDISLFSGAYENVIKEDAQNAGTRDTIGLEYRGNYSFANVIDGANDITGYLYYTYTKTDSSIYYDFATATWLDGESDLGDIAPHKVNLGMNLPVNEDLNINVRINYVSKRKLYLRNPLRDSTRVDGGREAEAYTTVDLNVSYTLGLVNLSLKVKNLLDKAYYHPGVESANAGDDFSRRSLGYQNSLIPQVGMNWMMTLQWKF
jgi:outer membrane receptor for ferrienterochelin and colicins